jgi:predicted O-methyltransferase YrrM
MLQTAECQAIARLWERKLEQDARGVPQSEKHRNLEPVSAEFIHSLAVGMDARRMLEIGGSSGVSTISLAAAARQTGGRLISIEIEPRRQAEARETLATLELHTWV